MLKKSLMRNWSKHIPWPNIPQLKLGNIQKYSPIFNTERIAKKIWRIEYTIASIWGKNMLGYLSLDIKHLMTGPEAGCDKDGVHLPQTSGFSQWTSGLSILLVLWTSES